MSPHELSGSLSECRSPGTGDILSVLNPADEQRGSGEPRPEAAGRVGPASPAAYTCLARAHGCRKWHSRWGWKAPSFTRPNHRLLCRRSTEEPLCLCSPQMAPCSDFATSIPASPEAKNQPLQQGVPPSLPTPATATDRINPGGDRSRDTGAINIPGGPFPPTLLRAQHFRHRGAAGRSPRRGRGGLHP
uniref:Uncharacterized protein n=1 Tax=Molossus molossus TaxID=27622 RepID=A0A7J8E2L4_MOLMO|nr:hypothetical protein HJG59_009015 [Molossus molossus]